MGGQVDVRPDLYDPEQVLRPGRFDPTALMVVGLIRGAAPVLFVIGLIYVLLTFGRHLETLPSVGSPMNALRALLSPLALVAIAVLVRFGTNMLALLLAYPLSRLATGSSIGPDLVKRPFRVWQDRLHLIRAFRSMRWTSPVRTLVIVRLGRLGYALSWVGTILTILFWVSVVGLIVVIFVVARS